MSLPVAILAGGLATRLGPLTASTPKSLIDVGGQPFAVHQIQLLRRHGFTDIVFLVGRLGEVISSTLGDGSTWGVQVRYVFDGPRPLGTGGAIRGALPLLGDAFFVLYGDSYLECDYESIESAFLASGKRGLMTVYRNEDQHDRSNVVYDEGHLVRYDKRQQTSDMRHIDFGLGAFLQSAFGERGNDPFDLELVYQELLAAGDLAGYEVGQRFFEIGSPDGLQSTRAHLTAKGVTR